MTVPVISDKVLLRPEDLEASQPGYAVLGTFNPGVARFGDEIILLVRVVEAPPVGASEPLVSPRVDWHSGSREMVVDINHNN